MPTITGHLMFRLLTADPDGESSVGVARWTGWELWNEHVRVLIDVESDAPEYAKFKSALRSLEHLGYIEPVAPKKGRRTAARMLWTVTPEGEKWWHEEGMEFHINASGKSRVRDTNRLLGVEFHATRRPIPPAVWKDFIARYKTGELSVTFTSSKKTGGS